MIGTTLSRYEIEEELGQGGMSTVYRGHDSALGRTVAVKVLHEHLAKKPDNRERFRREARAIATLDHPNILDVYDFSSEGDERSFIVMEYIPGSNLREFVDENGTPPPEIAALISTGIANALEHAHERGIIHRDLKPENVMISDDGEIKLMDFGIAHVIDAETMTKTGSLLGSPAHMAPELIDSGKVDERADIFSLGTVLYLLTTGELPFCGQNAPQVLRAVMECRFDEPEFVNPRVGHRLGAIVERSLHKDPNERHATVAAVRRDLLAAVHEAGIENTEAELEAYFDDPAAFTESFPEKIIPPLTQSGKRAIEKKNVPEAMGFFNRVLAYDPDNQEVQEALARLNRSQKLGKLARIGAASLALIAVGVGVWMLIPRPDPIEVSLQEATSGVSRSFDAAQARASTASALGEARVVMNTSYRKAGVDAAARAAASGVHASATKLAEASKPDELSVIAQRSMAPKRLVRVDPNSENSESSNGEEGTAKNADEEEPEKVTYQFLVKPTGARFMLNGKEYNSLTAAVNGIQLEVGKRYRVVARADACKTFRSEFVARADAPEEPLPVMLEYRNGGVAVTSNRPAVIFVDGKIAPKHKIKQAGGTTKLDFDFGKAPLDKQSKKVKIRVARADNFDINREQTVEVTPGKLKELNIQLP